MIAVNKAEVRYGGSEVNIMAEFTMLTAALSHRFPKEMIRDVVELALNTPIEPSDWKITDETETH